MATLIPIRGALDIVPPPTSLFSAAAKLNAGRASRVNRPDGAVWFMGVGGGSVLRHEFNLRAARLAETLYGETPATYLGPVLVLSAEEAAAFDHPEGV